VQESTTFLLVTFLYFLQFTFFLIVMAFSFFENIVGVQGLSFIPLLPMFLNEVILPRFFHFFYTLILQIFTG